MVRYIILVCTLDSVLYTLVNVYMPNTLQVRFLLRFLTMFKSVRQGNLVIEGDFNMHINSTVDSSSVSRAKQGQLQTFLRKHDLYDPWRCQHRNEKDYTFVSPPPHTHTLYIQELTSYW